MTTYSLHGLNQELNTFKKTNLEQQDLLRFMVTQIQNQRQHKTQANDAVLSQLADGVRGSLQKMATSLQSNQALQASALVGRKVWVNSDRVQLTIAGEVSFMVDIKPDSGQVRALIYSESGELIKTISLGQPEPGFFQFTWDGTGEDNNLRVDEGYYKIEVQADFGEKRVLLETMASSNIDSVSLGQNGEGLKLNVSGVGLVSLDQVRQISVS